MLLTQQVLPAHATSVLLMYVWRPVMEAVLPLPAAHGLVGCMQTVLLWNAPTLPVILYVWLDSTVATTIAGQAQISCCVRHC